MVPANDNCTSTPWPTDDLVDLLVVGGGINGTGIARDAAGRGLSVLLCEKDDLAQGTSSRSSRLIHGGLRYLEHGEVRLVREALREREVLLHAAPHLVRPLPLVLPHVPGMRPGWMLRLGLFLYDNLARRDQLPASRAVDFADAPEGRAVRPNIRRGFVYADCRTDDARLVVHNALGAREHGARVRTRLELIGAQARHGHWQAQLRDALSGAVTTQAARVLVNAGGPWVDALAGRLAEGSPAQRIRLVKGSHLVVPRFWRGDHGFLLQHTDRRVIFVTPYESGYALIGTTDVDYRGAPEAVAISPEETAYLCEAVNRQLRCALTPADVVHAYAGVRALVDDAQGNPSAVTRDYVLELGGMAASAGRGAQPGAPLLSVLGGKITTFRRLAEQALEMLRPLFPAMGPSWTARSPLPGGEMGVADLARAKAEFLARLAWLPSEHSLGLFERHGGGALTIVAGCAQPADLGLHFGAGLYEREVRHFMTREWALTDEDVLWRRSKFGLRLDAAARATLVDWMARRSAASAAHPALR